MKDKKKKKLGVISRRWNTGSLFIHLYWSGSADAEASALGLGGPVTSPDSITDFTG